MSDEIKWALALLEKATPGPWTWKTSQWNAGWQTVGLEASGTILSMATNAFGGCSPSKEDAEAISLMGTTGRAAFRVVERVIEEHNPCTRAFSLEYPGPCPVCVSLAEFRAALKAHMSETVVHLEVDRRTPLEDAWDWDEDE
jgi:hypothetical protein